MKLSLFFKKAINFLIVSNGKAQILNPRSIQDDIHMDQNTEFCVRVFTLKHLSFTTSMQEFQKSISVGVF